MLIMVCVCDTDEENYNLYIKINIPLHHAWEIKTTYINFSIIHCSSSYNRETREGGIRRKVTSFPNTSCCSLICT